MRFSEVFLRLGCALVGWMMLFTHFVWLAALGAIGCGPDGDEFYRVLLGLVPITIGFAFLLRMTRPFAEIHRMLRWLALPVAGLLVAGVANVWSVSRSVYGTGLGICSTADATVWHYAWSPAQVLAMIVAARMIYGIWGDVAAEKGRKSSDRSKI